MEERKELLRILRDNDHLIFKPSFVERVNAAFGTALVPSAIPLELLYDPKGDPNGMPSFELAESLCASKGLKYDAKHGRGSQVQACCDALDIWLAATTPPPPIKKEVA